MMGWKKKLAKFAVAAFDMPLSLYFTYRLLQHVYAPEILWFIFWLRIPLLVVFMLLEALVEDEE